MIKTFYDIIKLENYIWNGVYKLSFAKDDARKIIENLPEQATWDDIMYQFYVKKKVTNSLEAAEEGRTMTHEDVKKRVLKKWE